MMNQQEILRKIGNIIKELNEQHQYLSNTSKINLLELELFTANADFLIDHIEVLKKLNGQQEVETFYETAENESTIVEMEVATPTLAVAEDKVEEILIEQTAPDKEDELEESSERPLIDFSFDAEPEEMVFDFEKQIPVEEVFDRALREEEKQFLKAKAEEVIENPEPIATVTITEDEEEEGPEPFLIQLDEKVEEEIIEDVVEEEPVQMSVQSVEDEVKEVKMTLNDLLSSQLEQRSSAAGLGQRGISDLKAIISLNDKMIFIKELFSGYNLAYSEAIEIINRFESFEAADNFLLKNYAQKNNWLDKQEVVDRFYEYLNRKFAK
ncbi:hypothetical protein N9R54_05490 [Pelobium sp.]|nr:hypothetical protein [Pelobium sp.]MDA9555672.1 hypothetical protein [Pelobium sp.]